MNRRRSALYAVAALAATLVTSVPTAVPSFAAPDEPATVSSPLRGARTSAQLIHSAAAVNRFDEAQELRYLVDAFTAPDRLPSTLRGTTPPKSGTTLLAELHDRIGRLPDGPLRTELAPRVGLSATRGGRTMTVPALPDGRGACHTAVEPMSYTVQTPHFFVEHEGVFPPGLTLADYTTALERAYDVHVKLFGFAAPPLTAVPPPGGKYHVRIQDIGPDLYGYVAAIGTYAGNVGNNPSTSWNDGDAFASCMVLSATAFEKYDWARFSARDYLDDTVQHEFHHMVQYGMGLVFAPTPTGPYTRAIDANAVEGMAMWSEAESPYSRDTSNQWVWPILADSMGDPGEWDHYSYFTVWRAFTEPYGVGVPGGGEQLVQDYYEGLSQNKWRQLDGLDAVLRARGRTLPDAFHDQAISSLFSAACGGQYRRPFCWDDGAAYTTDGYRDIDYPIDLDLGEPRVVALPDDYSRQWFTLPAGRQLEVRVTGATDGGRVRVSVACNTGKSIVVRTLGTDLVGKQAATLGVGNQPCATPWVLVLTNLAQSSPDPVTSPLRVVHLHVQEKHDAVTATQPGGTTRTARTSPLMDRASRSSHPAPSSPRTPTPSRTSTSVTPRPA